MFERAWPLLAAVWKTLDERLRGVAEGLQRILGLLRLARFLLWLGVVALVATSLISVAAALCWVSLKVFLVAYAISTLFLLIPLVVLAVLVSLPLKLQSVVRLIDKGYPENLREIMLRLVARKLHDESIASEQMLWDTAVNEGRKFMRKMQQKDAASDEGAAAAAAQAASETAVQQAERDAARGAPEDGAFST